MRLARTVSFVSLCLLVAAVAVALAPARAQQQPGQEKRIALVIGNGAYAKGALPTAANDAGLIAQTLQAAGFDVIGARDLDGDSLRKSFRDFMQKAATADNNTVAMVYLSGYGVQLAGENYFIPVDSTIARDTDIPTEGLRLSDYIRQLAGTPLKAGIVVLDAARQQPFIENGPLAGGLALVEPDNNMLIAFNAAPGTIAPEETGSYGIYAQSLAEMIRTGGLSLPEVFDRVRLRVNDATKGAQVPWDAQKVSANFAFFERGPDAPSPQDAQAQMSAVQNRPIRDLGVQDAYAVALGRDTIAGYEEFLAAYPSDPLSKRVRAIVAARREAITWRRTYRTDSPDAYWSYLKRYPYGPHAEDARRRLAILTAPLEPPPSFAMIDYDVPPPPPEEIAYVDRPVLMFSDPEFAFAPPPPPPVYFLPPPPPDFVVLPPPIEPVGLFILPQPVFVPIPAYVRPPTFVAPPPNNVIFANIHNTTVINNVINQPPPRSPGGLGSGPGGGGLGFGAPGVGAPGGGPGAHSPATAMLPPAVAHRATLIQEGKAPVPPSASINVAAPAGRPGFNPAGRPGGLPGGPGLAPGVTPANVTPQGPQNAGLPRANALPVPGSRGAPPPPATGGVNPALTALPSGGAPPAGRGPHDAGPGHGPGPGPVTGPGAGAGPTGPGARPGLGGAPGLNAGKPVAPNSPSAPAPNLRAERTPPGAPVGAPPKPAVTAPQRVMAPPPSAMRPSAPPQMERRGPPPMERHAPPPVARLSPPPPRAAPPMMHAAPPPMARPAAPPPMARPAPPPVAAMARPAAPPPMMARPAAPPPRAAPAPAAKKCPPNQPHC